MKMRFAPTADRGTSIVQEMTAATTPRAQLAIIAMREGLGSWIRIKHNGDLRNVSALPGNPRPGVQQQAEQIRNGVCLADEARTY
ncbi:hypothetical protein VTJ04DRAFT_2533 [Mycothermus thermophilus]|uniref:uncharacterized protein n=1 Tax=Humicola insolens TaxID=85995 RepID=UPI003742CAC3